MHGMKICIIQFNWRNCEVISCTMSEMCCFLYTTVELCNAGENNQTPVKTMCVNQLKRALHILLTAH